MGRHEKTTESKRRGRSTYWRPWRIALLVLAAMMFGTGLYLWIEPQLRSRAQDDITQQMLQGLQNGLDSFEVDPNANPVSGEGYDLLEEGATPTPAQQEKVSVPIIGRIDIPCIDLQMPVARGATTVNLRYAIGWHEQTAAIGEDGLCVLFGHRMYQYGRHFNRLDEVTQGEEIYLTDTQNGVRYTFTVYDVQTVLPQEVPTLMTQPQEEPVLLLVTCTPVRVASHRLLVYARCTGQQAL